MKKYRVGILGATGVVGQQYLHLLCNHPLFTVTFAAASKESSGKKLSEAVREKWHLSHSLPAAYGNLFLHSIDQIEMAQKQCDLIFSALPSSCAQAHEMQFVQKELPLISHASYARLLSDVPLIIPECNHDHLNLLPLQKKRLGLKKGFIVSKPNCTIQSYCMALHPLHAHFKIKKVMVTTMQAISGAGYPGLASLQITDNVIPYIAEEEEKAQQEPLKIWGTWEAPDKNIRISSHCNRVPVLDGHLACVSVSFEKKPTIDEIKSSWEKFPPLNLPSAPQNPIVYREEKDRPQTRLDRLNQNGMAITLGRLRECPILDYRFVALSHNTIRGAAGGGVLIGELLASKNLL